MGTKEAGRGEGEGAPRPDGSSLRALVFLGGFALACVWACGPPARAQDASPDHAIRAFQARVQRAPGDPMGYAKLGNAYIHKARATGDATYYGLAEQALRRSLELAPGNARALTYLAYVHHSRHEFRQAAGLAEKALAAQPEDPMARGVLGDALYELGEYARAEEAYQGMLARTQDFYALARTAGIKSIRGDPRGAIRDLERAIEIGTKAGLGKESLAWTQWQLGNEHFGLGDLRRAEAQYRAALKTSDGYHRALAGLAKVRAAQRRHSEAIDLYTQAIAIIPLPEYIAALGDVYLKAGQPAEADKQFDLVEYIGRLNRANQVMYNRDLAMFYADHDRKLDEALALARKELEVRQDIYTYAALAWALYKNGRFSEADAASRKALALGTQDAALYFHAGMIAHKLGDRDRAKAYLRRALQTNRYFHLVHADVARGVLRGLEPDANARGGRRD
jgi:tetratricopeptide (TPR) repeat protein